MLLPDLNVKQVLIKFLLLLTLTNVNSITLENSVIELTLGHSIRTHAALRTRVGLRPARGRETGPSVCQAARSRTALPCTPRKRACCSAQKAVHLRVGTAASSVGPARCLSSMEAEVTGGKQWRGEDAPHTDAPRAGASDRAL